MGVSNSKSDENAVDRLNNRTISSKSATMKGDSSNNNLAVKNYLDKPRSVSSNDVISENNNDAVASSSSSNSLSSNLRSRMSLLRKPAAGLIRNSSTTSSARSTSSKASSATVSSTSTIVNSFMTNMNSSGARGGVNILDNSSATNSLSSYPYPRSHSTNLVLPLRPSAPQNNDSSTGISGLRRPLSLRRGQGSTAVGSGYGRTSTAVLQIPSPVPSVSEPSASEDNLSMDTVENSGKSLF